jgi:hypothetical protein
VLSHGREGYIYATDKLVPLEMLTQPFKGDKCPSLVGKPKLFFIQVNQLPYDIINKYMHYNFNIYRVQIRLIKGLIM